MRNHKSRHSLDKRQFHGKPSTKGYVYPACLSCGRELVPDPMARMVVDGVPEWDKHTFMCACMPSGLRISLGSTGLKYSV